MAIDTSSFIFTFAAWSIRRRLHRRRGQQPGQICVQTVRSRLRFDGLRARRLKKKPRLLPNHRQERLAFARHHMRWSRCRWETVLFTDESHVSLHWVNGRRRVWRRRNQDIGDEGVQEVDAFGGRGLLVWAGISRKGEDWLSGDAGKHGCQSLCQWHTETSCDSLCWCNWW